MVHQTFVWWALYILYRLVKFPIRHLSPPIGNVRCVWRFSSALHIEHIFENITYITKKDIKVSCQNFGYQLWFCTRLLMMSQHWFRISGNGLVTSIILESIVHGANCWSSHGWLTQRYNLWPSDAIWRHKSGSTLAQVMACCLMAPSHYLNNVDSSPKRCSVTFTWEWFHKKCSWN